MPVVHLSCKPCIPSTQGPLKGRRLDSARESFFRASVRLPGAAGADMET